MVRGSIGCGHVHMLAVASAIARVPFAHRGCRFDQSVSAMGSSLSAFPSTSAIGKHLLHKRVVDTPKGGHTEVLQKRTLAATLPALHPQRVRRWSRAALREPSDSRCINPCSLLFTTSGSNPDSATVA